MYIASLTSLHTMAPQSSRRASPPGDRADSSRALDVCSRSLRPHSTKRFLPQAGAHQRRPALTCCAAGWMDPSLTPGKHCFNHPWTRRDPKVRTQGLDCMGVHSYYYPAKFCALAQIPAAEERKGQKDRKFPPCALCAFLRPLALVAASAALGAVVVAVNDSAFP